MGSKCREEETDSRGRGGLLGDLLCGGFGEESGTSATMNPPPCPQIVQPSPVSKRTKPHHFLTCSRSPARDEVNDAARAMGMEHFGETLSDEYDMLDSESRGPDGAGPRNTAHLFFTFLYVSRA